jgi:23S rRNA pseudouridine2605 synthase
MNTFPDDESLTKGGEGWSEDMELAPVHPGDREEPESDDRQGERLQKVLARAGIGSRRVSEEMIEAGRISVNGAVVRTQGMRVDPAPGLVHVGRLDQDTEGLLLLTTDGELAHRLAHPSFEVRKTYLAQVSGSVSRDVTRRLRSGVELEDGPAKVDSFQVVDTHAGQSVVEVVLHEGRKHIVRRLLAEVGLPVSRLTRTAVGPVELARMRTGTIRRLTRQEVGALHELVGL